MVMSGGKVIGGAEVNTRGCGQDAQVSSRETFIVTIACGICQPLEKRGRCKAEEKVSGSLLLVHTCANLSILWPQLSLGLLSLSPEALQQTLAQITSLK